MKVGAPARWATSASPVASITRRARMASRPAFDSVTMPTIASPSSTGATNRRWSIGWIPASSTSAVGHELEPLAVDLVGERLALRHGRAHRFGALLELPADAARLDRRLMPVPGEPLDADGRDVAAETAEALDQAHLHPGAGRRERRRKPARTGSDDQHVGPMDDLDLGARAR